MTHIQISTKKCGVLQASAGFRGNTTWVAKKISAGFGRVWQVLAGFRHRTCLTATTSISQQKGAPSLHPAEAAGLGGGCAGEGTAGRHNQTAACLRSTLANLSPLACQLAQEEKHIGRNVGP